ASTVPNTVSSASGSWTIPNGSRCNSRSRTTPRPTAGSVARTKAPNNVYPAFRGEHHAGEGESHDADEGENAEPLSIERLVDQHRQGVQIGDAAKFTAAPKLVDCVIEAREHLRCLRRAAQHEMDVGGEAQRMLFDTRAFLPAPGCGGGSNA